MKPTQCILTAALTAWAFMACSAGGDGSEYTRATSKTQPTDSTGGPAAAGWTIRQVESQEEDLDIGTYVELAVAPDGTVGLACWHNESYEESSQDGDCELDGLISDIRMRRHIYYAERATASDQWTAEWVVSPSSDGTPPGLSFGFSPAGVPHIAFAGGEPLGRYCGGHDTMLATKSGGSWSVGAVVTGDTQQADETKTEAGNVVDGDSGAGFVIGRWSDLAFDASGAPGFLFQDNAFGAMQGDDFKRAEAEVWWSGGWEVVDANSTAGQYGNLVFDNADRPVAFYAINGSKNDIERKGLWAGRRETDRWKVIKLKSGAVTQKIAAAVNPLSDDLAVAFYDDFDKAVKLRTLSDPAQFEDISAWREELVGDARFVEGKGAISLAFTPWGEAALAYRRCVRNSVGDGNCNVNDEAVIFAREKDGEWDYEVVKEADVLGCGEFLSLGIGTDGNAHLAYRCNQLIKGEYTSRLFVASKQLEEIE